MQATAQPTTHSYQQAPTRTFGASRWLGLLFIVLGAAGWWYNWHLAETKHEFYIKLCVFGPFAVFGGLLMLIRPEWAGPMRSDSTRAHKMVLIGLMVPMFIVSGFDFYRLKNLHAPPKRELAKLPSFQMPEIGRSTTQLNFLNRSYRLGSFNSKVNAQWEFVTPTESINDWKTLLTVVDRPDARSRQDLDRLSEGIMANYKSHGGQIVLAKTLRDDSGATFNYMVAAFEDPRKQRYELNFVKLSMGPANAVVTIYGVRVADPQDYRAKAKEFLNQNSAEIGQSLASMALPDVSRLPRREF